MVASIRLVGSLLRMEIGEGPEEVIESTIWSAIVGLMICSLEKIMPAETELVLEVGSVSAAAGVTMKLWVKELDPTWLDSVALLCQRVSQKLQRDQFLNRISLRPFPFSYIPHESNARENVRIVPI